jgi:hypothetical protein
MTKLRLLAVTATLVAFVINPLAQTVAQETVLSNLRNHPLIMHAKTAAETQVWKTITLGTFVDVGAVRQAFAAARIQLGDTASMVDDQRAVTFGERAKALDLVVLAVSELGFRQGGASLADIYARAVALGFELCPAEVGPQLRFEYLSQPVGEFLHIAMAPITDRSGELLDLTVANGGAGLALLGGSAPPDLVVPASVRFVFVRPQQQIAQPRIPDDAVGSAAALQL